MTLPTAFLERPIAHRALHNRFEGRIENSMASIMAAAEAGYGIEIDVQPSSDGHAMVFHDDLLDRLTDETGIVRGRSCAELSQIQISGDSGTIPTLEAVLKAVAGRVPLLVEIKDQDGFMGGNIGALEAATAHALTGYDGDVAVMSFNPHSVAEMAKLLPNIPRGIVTSAYQPLIWPELSEERRGELREIQDYDRVGACFVSHEASDLSRPRIAELKADGARILSWTIRSADQEAEARQIADNVTFEGYLA